MAAHACLKNEFTKDEKCHNLMSWLNCFSGAQARIFSSTEQSYSSSYYTGTYTLSTSVSGVTFDFLKSANNTRAVRKVIGNERDFI